MVTYMDPQTEPMYMSVTCMRRMLDFRQTLRYLGAPTGVKSFLSGDKRSVVTSATLLHSTLTKRRNILVLES